MVTNKLASLFIEENLKVREAQAQGTSEFLSIELNATKAKLEEQERIVSEFKRKNLGELPEQREANLRVLDQLQLQVAENQGQHQIGPGPESSSPEAASDLEVLLSSSKPEPRPPGRTGLGDILVSSPRPRKRRTPMKPSWNR